MIEEEKTINKEKIMQQNISVHALSYNGPSFRSLLVILPKSIF